MGIRKTLTRSRIFLLAISACTIGIFTLPRKIAAEEVRPCSSYNEDPQVGDAITNRSPACESLFAFGMCYQTDQDRYRYPDNCEKPVTSEEKEIHYMYLTVDEFKCLEPLGSATDGAKVTTCTIFSFEFIPIGSLK